MKKGYLLIALCFVASIFSCKTAKVEPTPLELLKRGEKELAKDKFLLNISLLTYSFISGFFFKTIKEKNAKIYNSIIGNNKFITTKTPMINIFIFFIRSLQIHYNILSISEEKKNSNLFTIFYFLHHLIYIINIFMLLFQ